MPAAAIADIETGPAVGKPDAPEIDDVLYSLRQRPFTYDDMRDFLASEFNQENIDFWGLAEEFRQKFEQAQAPKLVRVAEEPLKDKETAKNLIVQRFIEPGSEEEVNISSAQRSEVLSAVKEGKDKGVFDSAQVEVRRLMEEDSFPRFLLAMSSHNITTAQADWRKCVGYVLLFLGAAVSGGAIALELAGIIATPLVRLASVLLFIGGFSYYISGKQKV